MTNLDQKWLDELDFLHRHEKIKEILDRKIALFRANFELNGDIDLFLELVYCLLTAQTKFISAASVVEELKYDESFEIRLFSSSDEDLFSFLMPILRKNIIRFHNNKAKNIVYARNLFIKNRKYLLREKLLSFDDNFEKRSWLIDNVLGLSYKEASHFLRNIGFGKDLAILDRHVLRTLKYIGLIDEVPEVLNKIVYLKNEEVLRDFSKFLGISMERLDFLLFALSKKSIEGENVSVFELIEGLK
ncbi:MAG: DNA lyase [Candidatus Gracilibacteria bacterium]|nr:DNA lyase [Candidatus Gracilibacteria bacterium]